MRHNRLAALTALTSCLGASACGSLLGIGDLPGLDGSASAAADSGGVTEDGSSGFGSSTSSGGASSSGSASSSGGSSGSSSGASSSSVIAIAAGGESACVLLSGGSVECWGDESEGELGNGTTATTGCGCSTTPVAVSGLSGSTAISVGNYSAYALLSGDTVECWGEDYFAATNSSTPVGVSGLSGVTAISVSAGETFACALLAGGTVECSGYNYYGELGNGTTTNSSTPVAVSGLSGATAISAGVLSACALLSGGTVECWGDNSYGELGNGSSTTDSDTPVAVSGLTGVTAVSVGTGFACALLSGGTVECWGDSANGQLGNGTSSGPQTCSEARPCSMTPVAVSGLSGATAISAGAVEACALLSGGTVECWGQNLYGGLGNGTTTNSSTPVAVSGLSAATAISVGGGGANGAEDFACALLSGGTVECWGANESGQLGNGTTTGSSTPVPVTVTW